MRRLTTGIACVLLGSVQGTAAASNGGRAYESPPAWIASISCRVDCVDARTARPGSLLRVRGGSMARVRTVAFLGGPGPRDDVAVAVAQAGARSVVVQVPPGAVSGRLRARNADGALSRPSAATIAVGTPPASGVVFPVRGEHSFGGPEARFGAARDDHSHEGQDVIAACGTPLVAARPGVVRFRAFHADAGNYVVLHHEESGQDDAYMHLQAPASVARGQAVTAGQAIGAVGDTGDARGCHLHFEVWSAPGWYEGGSPLDPLPILRSWAAAG